jgi:hypothetical protein
MSLLCLLTTPLEVPPGMRQVYSYDQANYEGYQNNDDKRLGVNIQHFGLLLVPLESQEPGVDLCHIREW